MANYVNRKELYNEIIVSLDKKQLSPRALELLMKMVKECARVLRYKDPEDKKDCMSEATLDILNYWNRFNPKKSDNAFSYYTQIIKNGLTKGFNKLYPQKSINMVPISEEQGIYNI